MASCDWKISELLEVFFLELTGLAGLPEVSFLVSKGEFTCVFGGSLEVSKLVLEEMFAKVASVKVSSGVSRRAAVEVLLELSETSERPLDMELDLIFGLSRCLAPPPMFFLRLQIVKTNNADLKMY